MLVDGGGPKNQRPCKMDRDARRAIKQEAADTVHGVGTAQSHHALRAFVLDRGLGDAVYDDLQKGLLMRHGGPRDSLVCPQKDVEMSMCFCNDCVPLCCYDDGDGEKTALCTLLVYPKYCRVPLREKDKAKGIVVDPDFEDKVHAYLQRIGTLPSDLPDMLFETYSVLRPVLNGNMADCQPFWCDELLWRIVSEASQAHVLFLVMCGHGKPRGAELVLANGRSVSLSMVAQALLDAKFKGTVVCALNACYAEPSWTEHPTCVPDGWHRLLPFRWVLMFSSWSEPQKPSHAKHFTRLLVRLAEERPEYGQLQDRVEALWKETRDKPQHASLWRAAPTVHLGGGYAGRFLEPAQV